MLTIIMMISSVIMLLLIMRFYWLLRIDWVAIMLRNLGIFCLCLAFSGCAERSGVELLNVSYDPTRELWDELNKEFVAKYEKDAGVKLKIQQSHAGSSAQAKSVIDGQEADVVTLAIESDITAIAAKGLIDAGWKGRLPNQSSPYYSTIVFVVRKGNPQAIRDWPDLIKQGVQVITPNPKTSGNGKLSFLAAWGAAIKQGGKDDDAKSFVRQLYANVPVLDTGARGATVTFAQNKIGDVHLTWENEARLEIAASHGELELVYPPRSIRAEPPVTWVDTYVRRHGTEAVAKAYLEFTFTPEGQEILARHHYRPIDKQVAAKHAAEFPAIELFSVEELFGGWEAANKRFFNTDGVFDEISVRTVP